MSPIQEINKLHDKLPIGVIQDLHKRMTDWLSRGGNHDDPYMFQQLRYAQNWVRRMEKNENHSR